MGIYIFDWKRLRNMLVSAEKSSVDMSDFGKNVIPAYLETGESVFAYEFEGYWKDVGTIESLWEANMEYISPDNALDSRNRQWKIYSRNVIAPPTSLVNMLMLKIHSLLMAVWLMELLNILCFQQVRKSVKEQLLRIQ